MPSPVRIKLLLFGPLREIAGTDRIDVRVDEAILARAISQLIERYPTMQGHKLLLAINEEYAEPTASLEDGDEVAVFTPVSGG